MPNGRRGSSARLEQTAPAALCPRTLYTGHTGHLVSYAGMGDKVRHATSRELTMRRYLLSFISNTTGNPTAASSAHVSPIVT